MPTFNVKDLAAGAVFAAIGFAFMAGALTLDIGSAFKMGPGYFPLLLSSLLALLGLVIMAKSVNMPPETIGMVPWRGLVLILAAPVIFGATVRGLGLLIALPLVIFAATAASRRAGLAAAAALVLGLTIFCFLVFSYGLGLPLPLIGRWLPI
jgi:putative tricarboxylic transport membrane protein